MESSNNNDTKDINNEIGCVNFGTMDLNPLCFNTINGYSASESVIRRNQTCSFQLSDDAPPLQTKYELDTDLNMEHEHRKPLFFTATNNRYVDSIKITYDSNLEPYELEPNQSVSFITVYVDEKAVYRLMKR